MKVVCSLISAVILALPLTGLAEAQRDETRFGRVEDPYGPKAGAFTFSPFFGMYLNGRNQALLDGEDYAKQAWNYGARFGWAFHEMGELEGTFGYAPTKTDVSSQNVYYYAANGLIQTSFSKRITAFATFGVGGMSFSTPLTNTETKFAINYGGGFKFFLYRNLALRPEFRAMTSFEGADTALMPSIGFTYYVSGKRASSLPDRDGDGIVDPEDRCPDEPETVNGFEDEDGCPDALPVVAGDIDEDGFLDDKDKCPEEAETVNGFQDEDGCPDSVPAADQDQDGIPDDKDKCPTEPETVNNFQDEDGCPDREIDEFAGVVEGINFAVGTAIIDDSSYGLLDRFGGLMKKHPDLRVRIEGHTDSDGSRGLNLRLSRERAESVRQYLVHKGTSSDRLEIAGYGSSRPIASNATPTGKARNRRVEFKQLNPEVLR